MINFDRVVSFTVIAFAATAWSQEACRTPNRRDGQCIRLRECQSYNAYFTPDRILNDDELNFLRQSQCSLMPLKICCPDRVQVTPTTTEAASSKTSTTEPTTTTTTLRTTSGSSGALLPDPKKFECGFDMLADKIIGGNDTTLEEFPWFALLNYVNKKGIPVFKCGGSLINPRYILTAAHCLDNVYLDGGERFVNVRLGEHNTATEVDCDDEVDEAIRECADPPQNIGFEEIILHPDYRKNDPNQHHDIALIRLERDAAINRFVTPICLPEEDFVRTRTGLNVTITGFGHTGRSRHSGVKQKALVPVFDQERCRKKWSRITLSEGQMCAGAQFSIDSCSGDSGGPLMTQRLYWTAEGIVSFGYQCGLEGWPGVYTRVSSYVNWIKSVIRE